MYVCSCHLVNGAIGGASPKPGNGDGCGQERGRERRDASLTIQDDMAEGGSEERGRRDASLTIEDDVKAFNDAKARAQSAPAPELYSRRLINTLDSAERNQRYGLWCIVS
jgi:hypothetical protein